MILVLDNYDSFTYNLVQIISGLGEKAAVYRNDKITVEKLFKFNYRGVIISPGPGRPSGAGISPELIRQNRGRFPILGVCLGHQAIAEAFGAEIIKSPELMHGKVSEIYHDGKTIFQNIPNPLKVVRYHSLTVDNKTLPGSLEVSARTSDGEIMAIRHKEMFLEGVQFHPESMLTEHGATILKNFLQMLDAAEGKAEAVPEA